MFDDYTGPMDGGAQMYRRVMRANPVLFPAYYPIDEDHQHVKHIMFGNYDEGNYINPYADMVRGYKEYSQSLMLAQQDRMSVVSGQSVYVSVVLGDGRLIIKTTQKTINIF